MAASLCQLFGGAAELHGRTTSAAFDANDPGCVKTLRGYNHTRNFGLYGHAESNKTQKFVFRSVLRPIQILFSHDQDPQETFKPSRRSLLLAAVKTAARPVCYPS
jgi:hypothetical protein